MARRRSHRRRSNPARRRGRHLVRAHLSNPRRRSRRRRNPFMRKAHHRHRRRNPFGISTRGIVGQLTAGAMDGAGVMVGRVFSRAIPNTLNLPAMLQSSNITSAPATAILAGAQLLSGALAAYAVGRFAKMPRLAAYVLAGSFDAVYEDLLQGVTAAFPGKQYLGDGEGYIAAGTRQVVSGYSQHGVTARTSGYSRRVRVAAYPTTAQGAVIGLKRRQQTVGGMGGGIVASGAIRRAS